MKDERTADRGRSVFLLNEKYWYLHELKIDNDNDYQNHVNIIKLFPPRKTPRKTPQRLARRLWASALAGTARPAPSGAWHERASCRPGCVFGG